MLTLDEVVRKRACPDCEDSLYLRRYFGGGYCASCECGWESPFFETRGFFLSYVCGLEKCVFYEED